MSKKVILDSQARPFIKGQQKVTKCEYMYVETTKSDNIE